MPEQDRDTLDGGRLFSAAIALWLQNFTLLAGLSFLISLGLASVTSILEVATGLSFVFVDLMIGPIISGLLVLLADDARAGRPIQLRAQLDRVLAVFWPLLLLSAAGSLLALGGMFLFILPGLYISAVLLPMVPLIVLPQENMGWEAMRESWALAKPYAWPLVAVVIGLIAISVLATGPVMLMSGALGGVETGLFASYPILMGGLFMFLGAAAGALSATISLTAYHRLRALQGR